MKRWVNHEGHEAHEGYDFGGIEPAQKITFLSFNFVLFVRSVVNMFLRNPFFDDRNKSSL
jgi:hypothetical protein